MYYYFVHLQSGGPCMRCATICMDPYTGERSSEPLLTLSAMRGGRPTFGIHLYYNHFKNGDHNYDQEKHQHQYNTTSEQQKSNLNNSSKLVDQTIDDDNNTYGNGNGESTSSGKSSSNEIPSSSRVVLHVNSEIQVVKWKEKENDDDDNNTQKSKNDLTSGRLGSRGLLNRNRHSMKTSSSPKVQTQTHPEKIIAYGEDLSNKFTSNSSNPSSTATAISTSTSILLTTGSEPKSFREFIETID